MSDNSGQVASRRPSAATRTGAPQVAARRNLVHLASNLETERGQASGAFQDLLPPGASLAHGQLIDASPLARSKQVLDQAAGENLAAYVRILRQLDALERMLARRADARPDEGSGEPPSALIEDKLQGTHAEPAKPEGSVQLEDISSRATTESTTMDDPPLTLPETSPHIPQAVTEGVVSREQMADSLFAAGKIRAAMDIYQELLQGNPAGDDAAWFHYQIASCLRRLGDPDTAARHLRIVAGQSDAEMLGEYAKWWLDSFQTKRSLRQALEDLQTVVDSAKGKP